MDPLSVLASVAGIATAGAALANTLFRLIRTAHHAPREIQSIAIEMSSLTSALEHLHDILANGSSFTKPSFLQGVRAVMTNIKATQEDISKMISDQGVFARIKWMKAAGLLSDIEKHKVTITLQTTILSAAILVKSTTATRTQQRPENRFRLQAETLVQAGQASIECDNLPRSYPEAPSERAPSPPVRTDKRLPSPVRRSEIPGHVQSEDLFRSSSRASPVPQNPPVPDQGEGGEASRAAAYNTTPSETERADLDSVAAQESALPSDFNAQVPRVSSNDPTYVEGENPRSDDEAARGRGNRPFGAPSYPVANFGHHFRVEGDAATFLYKLVFQDEWKDDEGQSMAEDYDEASERDEWTASDTDVTADESERGFRNRVRFESRSAHRNAVSQEPARVVDQLLLEWTRLSRGEVERGSASPEVGSDEAWGGETLREESRPREYSPPPRRNSENSNRTEGSPPGRRVIRPTRTNTPPYTIPLDNPFTRRDESAPKYPAPLYAPYINTEAPDGVPKRPFMGGYAPGLTQPYWTHPASFQQRGFNPTQANPPDPYWHSSPQPPPPPSTADAKPRSKPSAQKPTIVVLPRADTSDYETAPTSPELDASCLGLKIVQQEEPVLWNSDEFAAKRGLSGKAIMASLVGDKSARHALGMDLAHTLMRGQNTKLVYVRGNGEINPLSCETSAYGIDLGETWFINEEPVFLQFYHCGYLPQFYAARDADATAKREYVAVGEEWASAEAMSQLGLAMKGREDGRVLLDPGVTWSMVRELAITTLQLRCMRQRRQFTPTFYNSIEKFRDTHGEPEPLPLAVPLELKKGTAIRDEEPARSVDQGVDVFNFEVDNWKEDSAGDSPETKVEETRNGQPQIFITPSTTPQEPQTNPPELDQDDAKSDASCETLLSRFIHRCKPGRRNSLLSPMGRRNASVRSIAGRSGNGEWGGCNDKRELATASDSGVGTSIV